MSGRIRTIKPELLEDAVTAGLSDMAFRLFVSMILVADDHGRLRAEPGWLMGQIYWARTVQVETFLEAMKELDRLTLYYEVTGQRYAEIRNWSKHQRVSHPGKPRVPPPSEKPGEPPEDLAKPSGDPPESRVPDLRSPTNDQRPSGARESVASDLGGPSGIPKYVWLECRHGFVDTYIRAVRKASADAGWTMPAYGERDLETILANRCIGEARGDPDGWIADTVVRYGRWRRGQQRPPDWHPKNLIAWLNAEAGRASSRPPRAEHREPHKGPSGQIGPTLADIERAEVDGSDMDHERERMGYPLKNQPRPQSA